MNDFNKYYLSALAKEDNQVLNQHPVHEGSYQYDFELDGFKFHFSSDGTKWIWNYNAL